MKSLSVPQSNVGATLAVAQNPNMNAHGADTTAHGANTPTTTANITAEGAATHAQGDREGRPYGWALGLVLCFLFVLGCSNPYERDNPTDPTIVYTITFNANEATGGTPPAAIKGSYGDTVQIPGQGSLVRNGYLFGAWLEPVDSDHTNRHSAGSSYIIKGNATMNTHWGIVRTVTFDGNGATSGTPPATITANYNYNNNGEAYWIEEIPGQGNLQRTGYVFNGWTANNSGTGYIYQLGTSMNVSDYNSTLYAKWIPIYTVTFDGNGATGGTAPAAMTVDSNSSIQIPAKGNLERNGYSFGGWTVAGSSYTVADNITIYAKWIPIYTVTFNSNGATGGTAPEAVKVDSGSVIKLPAKGDLERSGYVFGSWNTNNSGTGDSYVASSSYTVTDNAIIYAGWISCDSQTHFCDTRDGNLYRITTIGEQVWMAENLNYNTSGSKCYNNSASNCDIYGRLYSWTNATGSYISQKCDNAYMNCSYQVVWGNSICPEGWHIPDKDEWDDLVNYAGGSAAAGKKLKATTGWNSNGNGTDDYSFSALPGGYHYSETSNSIGGVGTNGYWWSATAASLGGNSSSFNLVMGSSGDGASWGSSSNVTLNSVRCLKDGTSSRVVYGTPVTYEGQTYKTVVIGTQTWFAENLNYDATGSKCYDDLDSNCDEYGRLYNWETANTVCPSGWHLPSDYEWGTLMSFVSITTGRKLKATTGWDSNGNGTDYYGFSALPGGYGYPASSGGGVNWPPGFSLVGNAGKWWSASSVDNRDAYSRSMSYDSDDAYRGSEYQYKSDLYSVRCLKDN